MEIKIVKYLFLVILIGTCLRFAYLTYVPASLNWDEVSHGYNAYSLLKTGKDQWGQPWPIFNFRAYGDYPTVLNLYLTIPFIYLLGLTDFAVRAPHAILGILTILMAYFAGIGLTKRRSVGLVSAFLVAFGPWYIFTSRFVLQSNLSVFLIASALAAFFNRDKHKYLLPLSFFLIFLTLFSYHTTRIFSPLVVLAYMAVYSNEILDRVRQKKLMFASTVGTILVFFITAGYILGTSDAKARGSVLFILDQGAVNKIESLRNSSKFSPLVTKLIYNRPVYFVERFAQNYATYFSPGFLFFSGGTQYQFSLPGHGLILLVNLPFFYYGLYLLIRKAFDNKDFLMVLLMIILYPIPASLTNESFAVLRATTLLPLSEIVIALAIFTFYQKLPIKIKPYFATTYLVIVYFLLEGFLLNYFTSYRTNYSWSWQYGYSEVSEYVKSNYDKYDKIVVTKKYGEPHEFLLFNLKWDPDRYQNDKTAIRFFQSGWYWVDSFDKFYFVNDWQVVDESKANKHFILESKNIVECIDVKCLLVTSPDNAPSGWSKIKDIKFLDGKTAFSFYDNSRYGNKSK